MVKPKVSSMDCPRCVDAQLTKRREARSRVELDSCPKCRGIWFENGELREITSYAAEPIEYPDHLEESSLTCPHCQRRMATFPYPQTLVKVDFCRYCHGLWFDHDEYREIVFLRKHRRLKPDPAEIPIADRIRQPLIQWIDSTIDYLLTAEWEQE